MAACAGAVPSSWHSAWIASGSGLIGRPSSPQASASTSGATPSAASVAMVGTRCDRQRPAGVDPAGRRVEPHRVEQAHGDGAT
jgi:hypothetical protein